MIEEPLSAFEQIKRDPNFLMILSGAIIWFVGYYAGFLKGLLIPTGFVLVCFAAALNSVRRAIDIAWPGLLFGGLIQVLGYYLKWVPFLGNLLIVLGGVLLMYFTIPLAIQKGELPVLTQIQKLIEKKQKSKDKTEDNDSGSEHIEAENDESSVEETVDDKEAIDDESQI